VIKKLVAEYNLTMMMVTHQMGFAKDISDRVCFFFDGKIEEQGIPSDLFGNPQHERTNRQFNNIMIFK
jgi:polar amino acid transport system ATP-binding protein